MDTPHMTIVLEGTEAMAALAALKSGDCALLYALAASTGGRCGLEQAADTLAIGRERLERAAALLCLHGLARQGRPPVPSVPDAPRDIAETREGDGLFQNLCGYLETALGRVLRKAELETLHHIYGTLGLPGDVLVLIIGWCKENNRLSAREIERTAYHWHDAGITTYLEAEAFLREQRARRGREWAIRRVLGLSDRKPGESERKYLEKWVAEGLTDALISLAYDRTVGRTGKLSWAYMDKILTSWREKGLLTPEAVETGDVKPDRAAIPAAPDTVEAAVLKAFAARRHDREARLKARLDKLIVTSDAFAKLEGERRLCASKLARAQGAGREALEGELAALAKNRLAVLAGLGLPEDYLDDRPTCPLCGDHGYIGTRQCACFVKACRQEQARRDGAGI